MKEEIKKLIIMVPDCMTIEEYLNKKVVYTTAFNNLEEAIRGTVALVKYGIRYYELNINNCNLKEKKINEYGTNEIINGYNLSFSKSGLVCYRSLDPEIELDKLSFVYTSWRREIRKKLKMKY